MAEQPPLNRSYVISYAGNDRDYPVIGLRLDPRVAGYRVPEDLSPHPDSKRYPNHVFTGSQPSNGDERVTHVYEILPDPYVPFTRYDDDLGPIQGRRRSVKNEGQVAVLAADKRVNYEAREGSAIVYTEIEEEWSIKTDEDGNSLFPIKDRDFYDASRGAVQERRQLFVPTGEEEGTLENVNGVITQTSYEPYNEFLSVKVVQTYKVDGPQLIGRATDNDGQLVTVTTQRKGSLNYIPPNPTATRTVEVSREDAESLVERIVDTPEIFTAQTFSVERPDPIPQKFRVAVPIRSNQEVVAGQAQSQPLSSGQISITEEQRNKFLKRVSTTSRDQAVLPQTLLQKSTDNDRQTVIITETLQLGDTSEAPTATTTISSEALGDGNYVVTKTQVPEVFAGKVFQKTKDDLTPQKFRGAQESNTIEENVAGVAASPSLGSGEFAKSEQQVNKFVKRVSTTSRAITEAVTLLESVLTPEGQIGIRTLTLASGDQSFVPSALLVDANVEALGDGRTVKTETRIPNVFSGKTIRKTKVDLTPEKFKAKQEDTTTEETIAGTIEPSITLGAGEFAKSEQQVTEFVKRTSTTSRSVEATSSLNEFVITPQGQLATRNITLAQGLQTLQPSATLIDGSVEALGDGRSIKTEINVPAVFDEKQESKQKPDIIPQEFRASLPDVTTSEVKEGTSTTFGSLATDEVSKTIQRITEDKVRESVTVRAQGPYQSLTDSIVDNDGLVINRVKIVSKGAQTIVPSATTSGTVQSLGDGYTLKTEDTKQVFRGNVFSQEKPDNVPIEFRAQKPATTEEFSEAGTASQVSLLPTEISKSEQQVTEFVKRTRKTTRDLIGGVTLSGGQQIDEDGVKVTVTRSLQNGSQDITPSATVRGQVEDIGDGKTIKTELVRNEVFAGQSFSKEKPDNIPVEFRAELPSLVTEETFQGNANIPSLEDDELSKSEQQITKFLKRVRTTTREQLKPSVLVGAQVEPDGILSTVERTLKKGEQSIAPSATVSGNVQNIGNGYTVKTEIKKSDIFGNRSETRQKEDIIPTKFRADIPTKITSFNSEGGDLEIPELLENQILITKQQVDNFVNRETRTTRGNLGQQVSASGNVYVSDLNGGFATVTENFGSNPQITPSFGTVSAEKEYLGDQKFLTREVKINNFATLSGQNYDDTFDVAIPFSREIVQAGTLATNESAEIDPRNNLHSVKTIIDKSAFTSVLSEYHVVSGDIQNISLPDVLTSINLKIFNEESKSGSGDISSGESAVASGNVSLSSIPQLTYTVSTGYSGPAPAEKHIFFLAENNCSLGVIESRVGSPRWPIIKPRAEQVEIRTTSESKFAKLGISLPNNTSNSSSSSIRFNNAVLNIPPTLHGSIQISGQTIGPTSTSTVISVTSPTRGTFSRTLQIFQNPFVFPSIPATSPTNFPAGKYLYAINVSPYRYGFLRVEAIVVEVTAEMVSIEAPTISE